MQRVSGLSFAILLFLSTAGIAAAQTRFPFPTPSPSRTPTPTPSPTPTPEPKTMPCPAISVQPQGPQPLRDGQPVSFNVNIVGGDTKIQPTILWNLSAGTVKSGQNSRHIEVDSTGSGSTPDREIKADVWVGGYAPECLLQASAAVKVIAPTVKIGEVGELSPDAATNMLKVLGNYLSNSPDNLFLIAYAGKKSERGYAANALRRMREDLIGGGANPRRVNAIDGGFREEPAFEFYLVPNGSEPPRPTPTVSRNEIVYPKPTPLPPRKP